MIKSQTLSNNRDHIIVLFLISVMAIAAIGRVVLTLIGSGELGGDPGVWQEMSSTIVSGSAPYVDFPDNKPPLFILLVTFGGILDYYSVMVAAVMIANSIIVWSVYHRLSEEQLPEAGVIAATMVTVAIIYMMLNYRIINNKAISLAVLLLTLRSNKSVILGIGVALSGLLAQQTMVAIPVIIYYWVPTVRRATKFIISGLATAGMGYIIIGFIWGRDALLAAIDQSLLLIVSYTAGNSDFGRQIPIWGNPIEWGTSMLDLQQPLIFPAIASLAGFYYIINHQATSNRICEAGLLVSFSFLLLVRPWWHYGYYPLIPLSLLGGYGAVKYIQARDGWESTD